MTETDWTDSMIAGLTALWNEGLPTLEIGKRMGVSKNTVIGKVYRLGLPKRNSPIPKKPEPIKLPTLADLGYGQCRYPFGDPKEEGFHFCGEPTGGGSWCPKHRAVVFQKPVNTGDKTLEPD